MRRPQPDLTFRRLEASDFISAYSHLNDPEEEPTRMFDVQKANPIWEALRHRHKLAFNIAAGVILLFGIVAFLARQYSATAVVALNPHASIRPDGQPRSATEMAWTALTDQQIVSLIYRFHLDNGIIQILGQNQGFTYLRSKISLHQIGTRPPAEIAVSFTGQSRSSSIGVANAIAGILAQVKAPLAGQPPAAAAAQPEPAASPAASASTTPSNSDLEEARSELNTLAQNQGNPEDMQKELQGLLRTGVQMQAARQADAAQLSQLVIESERLSASRAHRSAAPAANPARTALIERIKSVQAHLEQLRQRYTEQYPDVENAETNLARLQKQLDRMPLEKSRQSPVPSPNGERSNITNQEILLQADQRRLDQAAQANQYRIEALRKRIARSNAFAQDYAAAKQQYSDLLRAQQAQAQQAQAAAHSVSSAGENQQRTPLFLVIQSATTAEALGMATRPAFWLIGLLAGLLAASLIVFLVERVSPSVLEEDLLPRSVRRRA